MTLLFLSLVLTLLVVLWHLAREVRNDGYGHRPPPRSHYGDFVTVPWGTPLP